MKVLCPECGGEMKDTGEWPLDMRDFSKTATKYVCQVPCLVPGPEPRGMVSVDIIKEEAA